MFLVVIWMLSVKPVYKPKQFSDDLKWTTRIHVTPFTLISKAQVTISMVLEDSFFAP